jgi:hypothetical protein
MQEVGASVIISGGGQNQNEARMDADTDEGQSYRKQNVGATAITPTTTMKCWQQAVV